MSQPRVDLPGSNRTRAADAAAAPFDPAAVIDATVLLRRRAEPVAADFAGPPLTPTQLAERFGADPAELAHVTDTLTSAGAEIVSADAASRLVRVRGRADVLAAIFGTSLVQAKPGAVGDRRRTGGLSVPASLSPAVQSVLGLDDRPQALARFRTPRADAAAVSYTPLQLAAAYNFPQADGAGQTIAIIELGGGFGQQDLDDYFGGLGLTPPLVTAVGVDGATNAPQNDPSGVDGEVLLDIEVAGAIAPGAQQFVYFAPNSDAGFVDAITTAAHATPTPTAISISWGQSEDQWTAQARIAMDQAMADAALLGVTVTAAAGDSGSTDNQPQGAPHVDFPASSPHALGCGGTALQLASDGSVVSETVWNEGAVGGATGGGVSAAFPLPDWQTKAGVPLRSGSATVGRGVPDVAAVADPQTGYRVLVDGQASVIGGTSAVSPLWAGLVCRLAQLLGRPLGLLQPALYAASARGVVSPGFRDVTSGSNGAYSAGAGWDACTGLGVADGAALLAQLQSAGG